MKENMAFISRIAAVEESNFIVVLHKVLFVLNVGGFFFLFL